MNQSRGDQGQSMEEILASIRRIIAEGEKDMPGHDPMRVGVAGPKPMVDTRPPWSRPEPSAPSDVSSDILVLTEMVRDDGTVVSLEPEASTPSQEAATRATLPSWEFEVAPPELPLAVEHRDPPPTIADETAPFIAPPLGASPEDVLMSIAAGLAIETNDVTEEAAAPPSMAELPTAIASNSPPFGQASGFDERKVTPAAVPAAPSQEMEKNSVSGEGLKRPELVSDEAVAASTAALAQLAQSIGRTRESQAGQSQTVDELVRGAVEPMLKQWLDANLSRIVERMVREAIERVVRRIE